MGGPDSEWEIEIDGEVYDRRYIEPCSVLGFKGMCWYSKQKKPDAEVSDPRSPRTPRP